MFFLQVGAPKLKEIFSVFKQTSVKRKLEDEATSSKGKKPKKVSAYILYILGLYFVL